MQKGKFGFSLWFYPFLALGFLLIGAFTPALFVLLFVIMAEQDEWAIKQTMHAVLLNIVWEAFTALYSVIKGIFGFSSSIYYIDFPGFEYASAGSIIFTILDILIIGGFVCAILLLALPKVMKGQNIALPGGKLVNRIFGIMPAPPSNFGGYQQPPQGGYPPAQGYQQQPPQGQGGYAPPPPPAQNGYQQPPQAGGYAPPPPPPYNNQEPPQQQ